MIAGEQIGTAVADLIAARIADMCNHGLVIPQRARDHGGCHVPSAALGLKTLVMDRHVRVLNQARKKAGKRDSLRRFSEALRHCLYCAGRCYLAKISSADTVGHDEHPAA